MTTPDLSALSDSARAALAQLAHELADKTFSGRIEMECSQGGVMNFKVTRTVPLGKVAPGGRER